MTVTFDELLDILLDNAENEPGFRQQSNIHLFSAAMNEWQDNNLTNNEFVVRFNLDIADPELGTVRTFVDGLTKAATHALEDVLLLGRAGDPLYDKPAVRARFGLT